MPDLPSNQSTNIIAGSNVTIVFTETEGDYWDIEFSATGGSGGGVDSIAKSGETGLTGDVTLSEGANVTLTQVGQDIEIAASGASGAPSDIDYLVGTASGSLSAEIVVGTTPGGELGGTWASPTVDSTHSGSTHSDATDTHIADATDAHDASAISVLDAAAQITATNVEDALTEIVDASQAHEAAGDPHTGYRLESADHTHQSTGAQAGQLDHGLALTGLTDDDHTQYRLESADHTHQSTGLQGGTLDHGLALTGLTDDDHTQYRLESADHTHQSTGLQGGQLDHGAALTGLTDDDHTQYMLESLANAKGDIFTATADNTPTVLTVGANDTILMADSTAGSGLKWVAAATPGTIDLDSETSSEGTADTFARGDHTHGIAADDQKFTVGGVFKNPSGTDDIVVWRAPFACTVTNVRGYSDAGTTTSINAFKGSLASPTNFLASNNTIGTADTWDDGGAVQNSSVAAGDALGVRLTAVGTATEVTVQIDLTRP